MSVFIGVSVPDILLDLVSSSWDGRFFPPTEIFKEGWMIKVLMAINSRSPCFPFCTLEGSSWFSEAQLLTPFYERQRPDLLYEKRTHSDGIIGNIGIDEGTKTGLILLPSARQFIVLEAKMFSGLSKKVTHANFYDQVSRTVACMSQTIVESGVSLDFFDSLGFYVVAPKSQIDRGLFDKYLVKEHLRDTVQRRVGQYENEHYEVLSKWYKVDFIPFLDKLTIGKISWESIIQGINDDKEKDAVDKFYKKSLKFNKNKRKSI